MKVKKLLLVFFFFIAVGSIYGQSLFDKKYLQATLYQLIKADSLGNIYIAGTTPDSNYTVFVEKFDSAGNFIWGKLTNGNNWVGDLLVLNNKRIILNCNNGLTKNYIFCLDSTGNTVYSKIVNDTTQGTYPQGRLINDGAGFTMASYGTVNGIVKLTKFDANANILYERKIIDSTQVNLGILILKCADGSYILSDYNFGLTRVDSNFTNCVHVRNHYAGFGAPNFYSGSFKLVPVSDTDFYYTGCFDGGQFFIGHIKKDLKCDWVKKYTNPSSIDGGLQLLDMQRLSDKSWMLISYLSYEWSQDVTQTYANDEHFILVHTDSLLNPIKTISLRSGLNSYTGGRFFTNKLSYDIIIKDQLLFTASHVSFDTMAIMQRSPYFEIIRTDSSFSGICTSNDTTLIVDFDNSSGIYYPLTFTTDTITTTIDTISVPLTDFIPAYGLCTDTTLSVPNLNKSKGGLSIFPNPATNLLHISLDKNIKAGEVNIFNVMGEKVYSDIITGNKKTINCSLPAGVYFVRVIDETRVYTGKVVIE
jgi:hypothetical protein